MHFLCKPCFYLNIYEKLSTGVYIHYLIGILHKIIFYNLLIKTRLINKRTNLGKIYFEKMYIINVRIIKANVT